ncbi:hypothetical protein, partial [Salmonella sp. s54925]|uniref:hypothetical protein n=1 Tax=Salmonella sp. s54925 TaxID=3159674 RepID=UPI00397EE474
GNLSKLLSAINFQLAFVLICFSHRYRKHRLLTRLRRRANMGIQDGVSTGQKLEVPLTPIIFIAPSERTVKTTTQLLLKSHVSSHCEIFQPARNANKFA